MIYTFDKEHRKYLTRVLGNGFNCIVKTTPPKIVQDFKDFNAWMKKEMHKDEVVHFV